MANMKNVMKKIEKVKINERYDISYDNLTEIFENSQSEFDLLRNGFRIGYLQGMKVAKAEMKRGVNV